jgi:PAS domain-containing protein
MRVLLQRVEAQRSVRAGVAAGMRDGLIVLDPAARVEFANPQAQQMLGLEGRPMDGISVDEVTAAFADRTDSLTENLAAWQRAVQQPESRPRF